LRIAEAAIRVSGWGLRRTRGKERQLGRTEGPATTMVLVKVAVKDGGDLSDFLD
jgi:hypothetical protein